jgi:predicted phosphoribosyltransferase
VESVRKWEKLGAPRSSSLTVAETHRSRHINPSAQMSAEVRISEEKKKKHKKINKNEMNTERKNFNKRSQVTDKHEQVWK